ncbi:dihydroorotase [Nonlabens marinus]|uniref:Dihydroorotase n=1 Tax=Nonlabens marinus S1-08 TaxID=1454201 RepID=W8VSU4_9FLAO|nr:dihydroorotase [Nonlabens marinus]BAO56515.1 dihydroorotase [Nonlabens marinus S1-08]
MILIKNARIICASSEHHMKQMDILIRDGIIENIASSIENDNAQVIEQENLHVSIGWFDSSVSFGEPGFEERQTMKNGLQVAATSGFTHIMLNPNNQPNPQDASGINYLKSISSGSPVTVLPVGNFSLSQEGAHLAELYDMHQAGAVSFYDYKHSVENANLLKVGLQYVKPFKGIIQSFPQDAQIAGKGMINEDQAGTELGLKTIPTFAEELRVARDIELARYTGSHLHIPTVTTNAALLLIDKARESGVQITCSVAIHHFTTASDALLDYNTNFKVQPPLRDVEETKKVLDHVKNGLVDMITSDHIPLTIESKDVEFDQADYGSTGLESAFGMANEALGTEQSIELLTGGYAVFQKELPKLEKGSPANLTFFDPSESYVLSKQQLSSTSKNSLFIGRNLKGKVLGTYNNQKLQWNERNS